MPLKAPGARELLEAEGCAVGGGRALGRELLELAAKGREENELLASRPIVQNDNT